MIFPTGTETAATDSYAVRPTKTFNTAQKLEAAFLAEMLKAAGVGETPDAFGGGTGEDQFASFLREAQAREMVQAGGLGLAAHFEQALQSAKR